MKNYYIAILRGGPSSEFDVSMRTGDSMKGVLSPYYRIQDVIIDKNEDWFVNGVQTLPGEALKGIDAVVIAMHGEYGEDGKIQALLHSMNIPYTGSEAFPSAVAMNKLKSKEVYKKHGIKVPHHVSIKADRPIPEIAHNIFRTFPMPVVLKPVAKGSSIGVTIARDYESLENAIGNLFVWTDEILIEEYIKGKEATVGVIERFRDRKHYSLFPVEITPPEHKNLFDYECKYDGSTTCACPGNFSQQESAEMQRLAELAHEILDLRHYSRTDFMIHPTRGIFMLETNTLPGMTSESLFPKGLEPIGSSYEEFLHHIIELAIQDHQK